MDQKLAQRVIWVGDQTAVTVFRKAKFVHFKPVLTRSVTAVQYIAQDRISPGDTLSTFVPCLMTSEIEHPAGP